MLRSCSYYIYRWFAARVTYVCRNLLIFTPLHKLMLSPERSILLLCRSSNRSTMHIPYVVREDVGKIRKPAMSIRASLERTVRTNRGEKCEKMCRP